MTVWDYTTSKLSQCNTVFHKCCLDPVLMSWLKLPIPFASSLSNLHSNYFPYQTLTLLDYNAHIPNCQRPPDTYTQGKPFFLRLQNHVKCPILGRNLVNSILFAIQKHLLHFQLTITLSQTPCVVLCNSLLWFGAISNKEFCFSSICLWVVSHHKKYP